ncbi:hypothetical protein B0H63DRAFT_511567 [Podospora didyma]|uniref:Transmembrane protein n=1 Tax=Podospora didyma TaxID=330526 RepID=A0AAE0NHZ4_9PEZI|nr:hypothetical protein B0H63DRAFT_511567 [Podospora didyma]
MLSTRNLGALRQRSCDRASNWAAEPEFPNGDWFAQPPPCMTKGLPCYFDPSQSTRSSCHLSCVVSSSFTYTNPWMPGPYRTSPTNHGSVAPPFTFDLLAEASIWPRYYPPQCIIESGSDVYMQGRALQETERHSSSWCKLADDDRTYMPISALVVSEYCSGVAFRSTCPDSCRRTVVSKLSSGLLGRPHAQAWVYMGPIMASVQIIANAINAIIIRQTPGYESVDVGRLILIWLMRQRLAWLAVGLPPLQFSEALYLSSATSALAAEVLLQLVSAFAIGYVANYGRVNEMYTPATTVDASLRREALLMYAGAMMWLAALIFSIAGIVTCFARLDAVISLVGRRIFRLEDKD